MDYNNNKIFYPHCAAISKNSSMSLSSSWAPDLKLWTQMEHTVIEAKK